MNDALTLDVFLVPFQWALYELTEHNMAGLQYVIDRCTLPEADLPGLVHMVMPADVVRSSTRIANQGGQDKPSGKHSSHWYCYPRSSACRFVMFCWLSGGAIRSMPIPAFNPTPDGCPAQMLIFLIQPDSWWMFSTDDDLPILIITGLMTRIKFPLCRHRNIYWQRWQLSWFLLCWYQPGAPLPLRLPG